MLSSRRIQLFPDGQGIQGIGANLSQHSLTCGHVDLDVDLDLDASALMRGTFSIAF